MSLNRANSVNSSKASADYARTAEVMPLMQRGQQFVRRFQPRLWPTLAAAVLVPIFLAAGQWQWNKANAKAELQQRLEAGGVAPSLRLPATLVDAQELRFRKIVAHGHYEPQHQILIDNRTYHGQGGYHIVTPLRLEGSETRVLINRGWIPALAEHRYVPVLATPEGRVELSGTAIVPGTRFFSLAADNGDGTSQWQGVWQNLDLERYRKAVGFAVQPVVIQLDPESTAGGFVREWPRPDERIQTNLSYAIQWWTFAATTVVLWFVFNIRRSD